MRLLHLSDVAVVFPARTLLSRIQWSVFRGDRYGLVGANGSGKTTLLRLMNGECEPSAGGVQRARDLNIGYLPQEVTAHRGKTLFDEAWAGLPDLPQIERDIDALREQLALNPRDEDRVERLGVLQHRWEDLEGYRAEAKVSRVLSGLGFREEDKGRRVEEFSGGWQMRIALAKLLLFDPDLLLLDEPTNHLDLPALLWLEDYLLRFAGALMIVSHDRRFLDRVVQRVAELDRGELTLYPGNYSEYETARETRRGQLEIEAERRQSERERIERFVERFRYKATKARQVQSRIKMLEKLAPLETQRSSRQVHFRFPAAPPSGRFVLDLQHAGKSYGEIRVFDDVNIVLARGEKAALVGVNGAGKSTLCRLIAGIEKPSEGSLSLGHNVTVDYFAQEADFHLNRERTVLEEMEAEGGSGPQSGLRGLLGAFLFSGDDVFKPVSVLSGGEKSRLALAKMLLRPSNFIILDEPTNHLDMASQNVLLDALRAYEGTLLIVSHDRYFLDGLVTRVLELEGGTLHDWPGNLSEYVERKGFLTAETAEPRAAERVPMRAGDDARFKSREKKRVEAEIRNRLSSGLRAARRRTDELQRLIEQSESRRSEIETQLADDELYRDGERCRALLAEYEKLRADIPQWEEEWAKAALELEALEREKQQQLKPGSQDA